MRRKASISMDRHDLKFKNLAINANPSQQVSDSSVVTEIISRLESKYGKLLESYEALTLKYEIIKTFAREAVWEYNVSNCAEFQHIPTLSTKIVEDGAVAGDYCTDKLLHEGKFSSVYTCNKRFMDERGISSFSDDKSFRRYAIKVIDKSAINCVDNAIMVNNELRALRTLEPSLNVVGFEAAFHTERCIYIVTEWFPTDLYKFMSAHHLVMNEKIVSIIIRKLLLGLAFLGSHNIAHRDLKPENVLIAFNDHKQFFVKICDFGLCQFVEPGNSIVKGACGSAGFFAPETVVSATSGYCGFKADNFSVGCIVLELLSSPSFFRTEWLQAYEKAVNNMDAQYFEKSIHAAIMKAHSDTAARFPSCVAEFIAGALHIEPSKRSTVQEMQYSRWLCMAERLEKPANISAYFDFTDPTAVGRVVGSYAGTEKPVVADRHHTLKDLSSEWNSEQALLKHQASVVKAAASASNAPVSKDAQSPVKLKHQGSVNHNAVRRHRLAVSFDGTNMSMGCTNPASLTPIDLGGSHDPEPEDTVKASNQHHHSHHQRHEKKPSIDLLVQSIPFSDVPPHSSFSFNSNMQIFHQDLAALLPMQPHSASTLAPCNVASSHKHHRHVSAQLTTVGASVPLAHEDERVLHTDVDPLTVSQSMSREMGLRYLHSIADKKNAASAAALEEDGGIDSVNFVTDLQKQIIHEDNTAYLAFADIQARLCNFEVEDTAVVSSVAAAVSNSLDCTSVTSTITGHHHHLHGGKHTAMPRIVPSTKKSVSSSLKFNGPVR